jgi:sigma-B regulation protein RsbU (phosphoserine phosphatase)
MPDRSGMVLIGRQPGRFNESVNRIGLKRLMEAVMAGAPFGTSIDTIRVFGEDLRPLAIVSLMGVVETTPLDEYEHRLLEQAVDLGDTATHLDNQGIYHALFGQTQMQVAGPVFGLEGLPEGAILVNLSIDIRENLRKHLLIGGGLTLVLLILGLVLALPFLNRTVQPLARLTIQTQRLAERNFEPDPEMEAELARVGTGRDEVAYLGGALSAMVGRLQAYIVDLKETTAAKERIEGEMAAARSIQMGLLPHDFPPLAAYDLHAVLVPAKAVGGDLYDFFMLDERHLFFLIGDVTDKGVPAALFMAVVKTLFTTEVKRDYSSPSGVMERVNQVLCQTNPEGMFVTVCIGVLDLDTGTVVCSDGGHDPPMRLRQGGVDVIHKVGGLALGLFADVSYSEWTIQLAPGDGLVIYTDGVSEAVNADQQLFGASRLHDVLTDLPHDCSAHAVTDAVMKALDRFVGGYPQSDDITLLALRWHTLGGGHA